MSTLMPLRVLIVEDQPADAELILHYLRKDGFDPDWQRVETETQYLARLSSALEIIICDHTLPQFDSGRALHLLQERGLDIPFVIVSGTIDEEFAVSAMQRGAADYLFKDRLARLGQAVKHALQARILYDKKRKADIALRESEAQYRLLFDNNPLPMWIFDLETRAFLAVNTTALHHYGYSLAEFLQLTVEDICPSLEVPPLVNQPAQMMSGPGDGGVWTHRKKDGTRIEVETAGHRLTFRTRPAWLGLAVDVTER